MDPKELLQGGSLQNPKTATDPKGAMTRIRLDPTRLRALVLLALAPLAPLHAAPTLELAALRGQVVYVDFWASWCVPCRHSFPWMRQMQQAYGANGFAVVTINVDHDRVDAERFLAAYGPGMDVRFDPEGNLAQQYGVQGMPTGFLIDRQGRKRFLHKGFVGSDTPTYEQQIRTLLAEGQPAASPGSTQ